jgi:hypothetical protein
VPVTPDSTSSEEIRLARKPNYDYEKRRKEMERKAKKDAKREDRLRRKRDGETGDGVDDLAGDGEAGDVDRDAAVE